MNKTSKQGNPIHFKSVASIGILTAVSFIRTVPAVVISVTAPGEWDAAVVCTGELIGRARSRHLRGAVVLIAVIKTVIVAVTAPSSRHTALIGTGERRGGASVV